MKFYGDFEIMKFLEMFKTLKLANISLNFLVSGFGPVYMSAHHVHA